MLFKKRDKKKKDFTNVLTIDPGIYDTGWAYWPFLTNQPGDMTYRPSQTGVSHVKGKPGVFKACNFQCAWLRSCINVWQIDLVIIEQAEVWADSSKSMASATRGYLIKLITLIGRLQQVAFEESEVDPILVTVKEWKGQLTKAAVMNRIKRAIGQDYRSHDADAVGIGLSVQDKL